ncbi:MAG: acyltransferase family protein, partial [Nostoc sp.]
MIPVIKNRIYGLDILRAMAILFVVYGHGYNLVRGYVNKKLYNSITFDGVSIFFVLSGFLIGGILLKIVNKTSFERKELVNF